MLALVTGGAGFIGSHLCEKLLQEGHTVRALDNFSTGRRDNVAHLIDNPGFTLHEGDIRDPETLVTPFQNVEWVFHMAGLADIVPSVENPTTYFEVNVHGTLNVLEFARRNKAKRLVYAASSSSYGIPEIYPTPEESPIQPQYPYALTKYMGEELILHWAEVYKMPNVSLRMFNVYGPRSRTTGAYGAVFGVFLAQRLNNKPYTVVGDGQQSRDFTYVTDVCEAFYAAAQSDLIGEAMNVGSGGHQSINRLVELLGGEVTYIPKRPGEPDCTFADTTKIRKNLDWEPKVNFEQGVANMLACIEDWRDAPVWEPGTIAKATASWFKHLSTP
ncbi:SDR family oxidoreductase [Magnetococcus sp. PR-3]|uniref:SDR family oxidoreductase n=1 Tax=Magnetococcus sp. PR-3 TaxID=3120355 RepID=UPI002FCE65BF